MVSLATCSLPCTSFSQKTVYFNVSSLEHTIVCSQTLDVYCRVSEHFSFLQHSFFFLLLFTALQTKLGHDIVALYLLFLCSDVITGRQYHVISEAFMRAGRDLIFES